MMSAWEEAPQLILPCCSVNQLPGLQFPQVSWSDLVWRSDVSTSIVIALFQVEQPAKSSIPLIEHLSQHARANQLLLLFGYDLASILFVITSPCLHRVIIVYDWS